MGQDMGWHPTPFVLDKALGFLGLFAQGWEQMWGQSGIWKPLFQALS